MAASVSDNNFKPWDSGTLPAKSEDDEERAPSPAPISFQEGGAAGAPPPLPSDALEDDFFADFESKESGGFVHAELEDDELDRVALEALNEVGLGPGAGAVTAEDLSDPDGDILSDPLGLAGMDLDSMEELDPVQELQPISADPPVVDTAPPAEPPAEKMTLDDFDAPEYYEEDEDDYDLDFEVHTNVTNIAELQQWLGGDGPPPADLPPGMLDPGWEPDATSVVSGLDMGKLVAAAQQVVSADAPPAAPERPQSMDGGGATVSGSLDAFGVGELLQLFSTSRRTGMLGLIGANDTAKLWMNMGDVYAASFNGDKPTDGSEIIRSISKIKSGEFRFAPLTTDPPPANINMSMPQLLILLLADDDDLPSGEGAALDAALELADPLEVKLRDLTPDELDALQLVLNHKTLEAAMGAGELDPDHLQQMVEFLIERGYLKRLSFLDDDDDMFSGLGF
jgi:hypothetical protein